MNPFNSNNVNSKFINRTNINNHDSSESSPKKVNM